MTQEAILVIQKENEDRSGRFPSSFRVPIVSH